MTLSNSVPEMLEPNRGPKLIGSGISVSVSGNSVWFSGFGFSRPE
jgi:hypothetical protein